MIKLSECKRCSDTRRDYIQKYSDVVGIQLEMLNASFFRTLGITQRFTSSVFSSLRLSTQPCANQIARSRGKNPEGKRKMKHTKSLV